MMIKSNKTKPKKKRRCFHTCQSERSRKKSKEKFKSPRRGIIRFDKAGLPTQSQSLRLQATTQKHYHRPRPCSRPHPPRCRYQSTYQYQRLPHHGQPVHPPASAPASTSVPKHLSHPSQNIPGPQQEQRSGYDGGFRETAQRRRRPQFLLCPMSQYRCQCRYGCCCGCVVGGDDDGGDVAPGEPHVNAHFVPRVSQIAVRRQYHRHRRMTHHTRSSVVREQASG